MATDVDDEGSPGAVLAKLGRHRSTGSDRNTSSTSFTRRKVESVSLARADRCPGIMMNEIERGRQLRRPTGDKMTDAPFKVGDRVKKRSGYEYPGFIVSVFSNRAGAVRYVVEADHPAFSGMLHIFNGDQLEHR
jgi:hypothetical protein